MEPLDMMDFIGSLLQFGYRQNHWVLKCSSHQSTSLNMEDGKGVTKFELDWSDSGQDSSTLFCISMQVLYFQPSQNHLQQPTISNHVCSFSYVRDLVTCILKLSIPIFLLRYLSQVVLVQPNLYMFGLVNEALFFENFENYIFQNVALFFQNFVLFFQSVAFSQLD